MSIVFLIRKIYSCGWWGREFSNKVYIDDASIDGCMSVGFMCVAWATVRVLRVFCRTCNDQGVVKLYGSLEMTCSLRSGVRAPLLWLSCSEDRQASAATMQFRFCGLPVCMWCTAVQSGISDKRQCLPRS